MLSVHDDGPRLCDGLTRREWLRVGGLGAFGLSLPALLGSGARGAPNDWPCVAAVVQKLRPARGGLPAAITLPEHIRNTGGISWPGQDGGFLGRAADPWLIHCDPSAPAFGIPGLALPPEVPPVRLSGRLTLLGQINRHLDGVERSQAAARYDNRSRQALDLLT